MKSSTLLREPLLHFLVLGLLIFAADHYIRPPDRLTITINNAVERELVTLFKDARGREPTDYELNQLFSRWLQNEVYYREALGLGLDQGDEMFRSRLVLKMREVVMGNLVVPTPSNDELKGWFESHRANYDSPERFDVSQFFVADLKTGNQKQVSDLLETVREAVPQPYTDQVRSYRNLSPENLSQVFGSDFAAALLANRDTTWRVLQSKQGWHIARVDALHPAVPAVFDEVKHIVKADWEAAQRRQKALEAIRDMRMRYTIVMSHAKRLETAFNTATSDKPGEEFDASALVEPKQTWAEDK